MLRQVPRELVQVDATAVHNAFLGAGTVSGAVDGDRARPRLLGVQHQHRPLFHKFILVRAQAMGATSAEPRRPHGARRPQLQLRRQQQEEQQRPAPGHRTCGRAHVRLRRPYSSHGARAHRNHKGAPLGTRQSLLGGPGLGSDLLSATLPSPPPSPSSGLPPVAGQQPLPGLAPRNLYPHFIGGEAEARDEPWLGWDFTDHLLPWHRRDGRLCTSSRATGPWWASTSRVHPSSSACHSRMIST